MSVKVPHSRIALIYGLSPKILMLLINIFSLTSLIHGLGLKLYASLTYIGAIIFSFEIFFEFGLTSYAGKDLSSGIDSTEHYSKSKRLFYFQAILLNALIWFFPTFVIVRFIFNFGGIDIPSVFILLSLSSSLLNVVVNYYRILFSVNNDYKNLGIVDLVQSIFRNITQLLVAFYFKSLLAYFIIDFVLVSLIVVYFYIKYRHDFFGTQKLKFNLNYIQIKSLFKIWKEAKGFLFLRVVYRLFDEFPKVLLGFYGHYQVLGIIGAASKYIKYCSFPFYILGNSIMVNIQKYILLYGSKQKRVLLAFNLFKPLYPLYFLVSIIYCLFFESIFNIFYIKLDFVLLTYLISFFLYDVINGYLSSTIDYVGGLRNRIGILLFISLFQILMILVFNNNASSCLLVILTIANFCVAVSWTFLAFKYLFFDLPKYFYINLLFKLSILSFILCLMTFFAVEIFYIFSMTDMQEFIYFIFILLSFSYLILWVLCRLKYLKHFKPGLNYLKL